MQNEDKKPFTYDPSRSRSLTDIAGLQENPYAYFNKGIEEEADPANMALRHKAMAYHANGANILGTQSPRARDGSGYIIPRFVTDSLAGKVK